MRTLGKVLLLTSVTMVLVTLISMAAWQLLVSSVPGCITIKGEAVELVCGSASGPIKFFAIMGFIGQILSYIAAGPCFAMGSLLWILSGRIRPSALVMGTCRVFLVVLLAQTAFTLFVCAA